MSLMLIPILCEAAYSRPQAGSLGLNKQSLPPQANYMHLHIELVLQIISRT